MMMKKREGSEDEEGNKREWKIERERKGKKRQKQGEEEN